MSNLTNKQKKYLKIVKFKPDNQIFYSGYWYKVVGIVSGKTIPTLHNDGYWVDMWPLKRELLQALSRTLPLDGCVITVAENAAKQESILRLKDINTSLEE